MRDWLEDRLDAQLDVLVAICLGAVVHALGVSDVLAALTLAATLLSVRLAIKKNAYAIMILDYDFLIWHPAVRHRRPSSATLIGST